MPVHVELWIARDGEGAELRVRRTLRWEAPAGAETLDPGVVADDWEEAASGRPLVRSGGRLGLGAEGPWLALVQRVF